MFIIVLAETPTTNHLKAPLFVSLSRAKHAVHLPLSRRGHGNRSNDALLRKSMLDVL